MKVTVWPLRCECGTTLASIPGGSVACPNAGCGHFGKEYITPVFELKLKQRPKRNG